MLQDGSAALAMTRRLAVARDAWPSRPSRGVAADR
jgi:hypothetical protein